MQSHPRLSPPAINIIFDGVHWLLSELALFLSFTLPQTSVENNFILLVIESFSSSFCVSLEEWQSAAGAVHH